MKRIWSLEGKHDLWKAWLRDKYMWKGMHENPVVKWDYTLNTPMLEIGNKEPNT